MPFINGQKMACGPCIRGHRSTKCTHASERVMIPVRKPGRPLSSCACAPGRPCSCGGGLRVAIPKEKKCACGPGGHEDVAEEDCEHTPLTVSTPSTKTMTATSTAAPSPAPSSYRVTKPNGNARPGSRKQSFDHVNLERMDPNSINIVNSYNQIGRAMMTPLPNATPQQIPPPATPAVPIAYMPSPPQNGFSQGPHIGYSNGSTMTYTITASQPPPIQVAYAQSPEAKSELDTNGASRHPSIAPAMPAPPMVPLHDASRRPSLPAVTAPGPPPVPKSSGGGCCCGGAKAESPKMKPDGLDQQQLPYGFVPPYQQVQFEHPTTFTYPAQYGSWQNPINPVIWQQLLEQQGIAINGRGGIEAGTSHNCSCGPGCQCVGCLTHPYNSGTLAYISEAYNEDGMYVNGHGNTSPVEAHPAKRSPVISLPPVSTATPAPAPVVGSCCGGGNSNTVATNGNGHPADSHNGDVSPTSPPPTAHTPSDASGVSSEEQLSMNDYLFLDMPFDGTAFHDMLQGCGGNSALCPCGPGCPCDGCEIHKRDS